MISSYDRHQDYSRTYQSGLVNLSKPKVSYIGYKKQSDYHVSQITTSYPYRYKEQAEMIESIMRAKDEPHSILCIGAAEGQEPLTYIQTALEIAQEKNAGIDDVLDLSVIEASEEIPVSRSAAERYGISPFSADYLERLYKDKEKAHFSSPFETVVPGLKKEGKKYDTVLFNNVVQHMNWENPKKAYESIAGLMDLVKDGGTFCFSTVYDTIDSSRHTKEYKEKFYDNVLKLLDEKGFTQIDEGVFQKKKSGADVSNLLRAQCFYQLK